MIVGNGDVAKVLTDKEGTTFFASGVSNSQETRESEYEREVDLLLEMPSYDHLVYFSSLSIFYSKTRYTQHKLMMEDIVRNTFKHFTIIRLGNIAWGDNPNTIINFFRNQLEKGEKLDIRDEHRYVIEKEEFLHWINLIPRWNCEMNLTGQYLTIKEIVNKYVKST